LTGRELQIAAMIAQGDATKNVAYKLRISEWTVGTHLRRIFAKLGVDNRAAMVFRCASLIENAQQPEETRSQVAPSSATRYGA
jgi:DNA-binding CsgD family transcriptional regulator